FTDRVFRSRLPDALADAVRGSIAGGAQFEFVDRLLRGELPHWFAPATAAEVATEVFAETIDWIEASLGSDRSAWHWGAMHTLTFAHPLAGAMGRIGRRLNSSPAPLGGDRFTIRMSWWPPSSLFDVALGPSMRLVADLSREDALWVSNTL